MRGWRLLRLVPVAAIVATVVATSSGLARLSAAPPIRVTVPTVEAVDGTGADVTYSVKAYDPVSDLPLAATCDHPDGSGGSGDFQVTGHFPVGDTSASCSTTTQAGDPFTKAFTVTVQDTTAPTVTVPSDVAVKTTNSAGTAVSYGSVTAVDTVDGALAATCDHASGSVFPVGPTTVSCSATDAHSNTGQASFTVTVTLTPVVDVTPPVLTVPANFAVTTESATGKVVSYTASATDDVDGPITPSCTTASGSLFPVGATGVSCSATDSHGNTAAAGFTITVNLVDTTAPVITVPASFSVPAPDPSGVVVSFVASATDNLDGPLTPVCAPASETKFSVGATTVTCTAVDAHSNQSQQTFVVTVVFSDTAPPVLAAVPDLKTEANGPNGSIVTYATPSAIDAVDGPIPIVTCAPASGQRFPLGSTTVTCVASDSHGNVGTTTFHVIVVDSEPPRLSLPSDIAVVATAADGIARSDPLITAFLAAARATDIVDPAPTVSNDAPALFPIGTTTVTFTARDQSGNAASAQAAVIVYPKGSPPPPPPPIVDRTPPPDVTSLVAKAGPAKITLSWSKPAVSDFDHVVVSRAEALVGAEPIQIYDGAGASLIDRGVRNGVQYRYVVVSVDRSGNASAGVAVVAVPKRILLVAPLDGARVAKPPLLRWIATKGADYYNVQLFRGTRKILTIWPLKSQFALHRTWTFGGRRITLTQGAYQWYVWPGFGARAAVRYGNMLGSSSFAVTG
jgi:hypothetical protein